MPDQLNLTKHIVTQLDKRYPSWNMSKLKLALELNPEFEAEGQKHTYLGTGFDIWGEDPKKPNAFRKRIQRRHLFLVSKKDAQGIWTQVTVVHHSTKSLFKWLNKQDTKIIRSDNIYDHRNGYKRQEIDGALVYTFQQHPLSLRTDMAWSYGEFNIIVKYYM